MMEPRLRRLVCRLLGHDPVAEPWIIEAKGGVGSGVGVGPGVGVEGGEELILIGITCAWCGKLLYLGDT